MRCQPPREPGARPGPGARPPREPSIRPLGPVPPSLAGGEQTRDAERATAALKPPRPALLAALRQPGSASGLARRLDLPRQRVNHHLRELEEAGLVVLVEQRRQRGCIERVMLATAQQYLLSPELLGGFPEIAPAAVLDHDPIGWSSLAVVAGRTIQDLAELREHLGEEVPALSIPTLIRFSSPQSLDDFVRELSQEIARLLAKYHDETAASARHWFFLGTYPMVPSVTDDGQVSV